MKNLFLIAIVVIGFTSVSFGQATGTSTSSATIITPILITKTVDMNFGNVAVNATAGTVVLTPLSAATRSITGGVTLPAVNGTVTAASFKVDGEGTSAYSITLPSTDLIITDGAAHNMTVNAFTSTPTSALGGVLTGGTQTIYVGATLNVGATQVAGTYTSATPFSVTVNYN